MKAVVGLHARKADGGVRAVCLAGCGNFKFRQRHGPWRVKRDPSSKLRKPRTSDLVPSPVLSGRRSDEEVMNSTDWEESVSLNKEQCDE